MMATLDHQHLKKMKSGKHYTGSATLEFLRARLPVSQIRQLQLSPGKRRTISLWSRFSMICIVSWVVASLARQVEERDCWTNKTWRTACVSHCGTLTMKVGIALTIHLPSSVRKPFKEEVWMALFILIIASMFCGKLASAFQISRLMSFSGTQKRMWWKLMRTLCTPAGTLMR